MTAAALPRSTALVDAGREWGKPLSPDDARVLTAQIKTAVEQLLPLIRTAFQRRADLALGYPSWEAYCDAELVGLRLAVADRPEAVIELRRDGMSQRAIGAALGVSAATVNRALATVSDETVPDRVIGTDGKLRPATRPAPKSDVGPDVLRALTSAGAAGMTAWQVAFLLDSRSPDEDGVRGALFQLCDAGKAIVVGQAEGGALWALTEFVDGSGATSPAPEPETCLGADMDCGRPLPCPDHPRTPEERIAAVAEVAPEFVKPVEPDAPKPTLRIVPTDDEKQAAERRDARALLSRGVDLLAPAGWKDEHIQAWIEHMGAADEELAALKKRAAAAIAVLTRVIEEAGR